MRAGLLVLYCRGMKTEPRKEYECRIEQRRRAAANRDLWHHRIGNARLALFIAAAVVAILAYGYGRISGWWLLLPLILFLGLAIWHGRVLDALQRLNRAIRFYELGFARLDERWTGTGEPGTRFRDSSHPYCEDLDLFGTGSLFELLCSARTHAGERMLASWLKSPAGPDEILLRQQSIAELRSNLDLREELAILGGDVRAGVEPDPLIAWGEEPDRFQSYWISAAAAALALLAVAGIVMWAAAGYRELFFAAVFGEVLFAFSLRLKLRHTVSTAESIGRNLSLLSMVLGRLEKEDFKTPHLRSLRTALESEGIPPSRLIKRLDNLIVLLESRRNPFFAPFAFILMWEVQLAFLIERWRSRNGRHISAWLATVAELEALSSLAGYSFEHPADPFPEIVDRSPCFDGEELGHPLLPEDKCVRNTVTLDCEVRVLLVSGSNMSGKSTLLRTVGINTVLALAGAPVRARRLRISPLALGASIRVVDSLQAGTSRFYAEIVRLRKLVELADGDVPLLFLLDELLHGTNSHDRRIGAEAIVRGMVRRSAIGLLTTHDLALAHMAEELAPHAVNVHFEDHIEDGRMAFDYRLRPGVVRKSNALELMRSIGLEV